MCCVDEDGDVAHALSDSSSEEDDAERKAFVEEGGDDSAYDGLSLKLVVKCWD